MQKDWFLKNIENAKDLKDILQENDINMLYWYIANHSHEFTLEECEAFYEILSMLDDKFNTDEE